jgi:uncharacterized membrane protein
MAGPQGNRPKLHIPRSPLEKALELVSVLGMIVIALTLLLSWSGIPATIPTHFGVSGQPNSYGSKATLLLLPGIAVFLYALLTTLSFFPQVYNFPWRITEQNAWAQYRLARQMLGWLKAELIATFAWLNWEIIQTALGKANGQVFWFLPVALVVVFGTLGLYLRLLYRAR